MTDAPHSEAESMQRKDGLIERWIRECPSDFLERVVRRLEPLPNGCWEWTGSPTSAYGTLRLPKTIGAIDPSGNASKVQVHRAVWIAIKGHIPYGSVLDHDGPNGCKNRKCSNPAHLAVATPRENCHSGSSPAALNALKEFCVAGHPITDPALLTPSGIARGKRNCRQCVRIARTKHEEVIRRARQITGLSWSQYDRAYGRGLAAARQIIDTAQEA